DVNTGRLTACQADAAAGLYDAAMAGYIAWLARLGLVDGAALGREREALRGRFAGGGAHAPTPAAGADLLWGLKYLFDFARDCGAMEAEEYAGYCERAEVALRRGVASQAGAQRDADPVRRYLSLLAAALTSGRAHLCDPHGQAPSG